MRIFYLTDGDHRSGGQLVNLDHVTTLRRLGYDARLLLVPQPGKPAEVQFPPGRAEPWHADLHSLTAADYVVVGEMHGLAAQLLNDSPARKLIHNQNLYYTFVAFRDLQVIRNWGCRGVLTCSGVTAEALRRMGWDGPTWPVRPFIDPVFATTPAARPRLSVAAMPRKRPHDSRLIRGLARSWRPTLEFDFHEIVGLPRQEVAKVMAASDIFVSLSRDEGLGLPPLEAMATGALVVGFHGGGGREYATPENGDWFDDDQVFEVAEMLVQRLDQLAAGERFEARREAGRRTAAAFSAERFEAELAAAWRQIAGPPG